MLHDPAGPFIQGGVHQVPDVMSERNGAGAALGQSTHGYIWSGVSTMQEHEEMRVGAGMDSSNTSFCRLLHPSSALGGQSFGNAVSSLETRNWEKFER